MNYQAMSRHGEKIPVTKWEEAILKDAKAAQVTTNMVKKDLVISQ